MKITVFTSNQPRHLSLINDLAKISNEVFAVIEVNTVFPGMKTDFFKKSQIMQKYFSYMLDSEKKIFGEIALLPDNVKSLVVKSGDLNDIPMNVLAPLLKSDEYVVFGASFIKGDLIDFLIFHNAYNIHMGVSPYYRGSACNFWAAYDRNLTMVGATIHMLSKGLDSGPMLFHALPKLDCNPFDLGMKAVKSAHVGLVQNLANGKIKEFQPIPQDKSMEIRYTKNTDFDDAIAYKYLNNMPSKEEIEYSFSTIDTTKFLHPFIS